VSWRERIAPISDARSIEAAAQRGRQEIPSWEILV
jgi:hypothetical protein